MSMERVGATVTGQNLKTLKSIVRSEPDVHSISGALRFCVETVDVLRKAERKARKNNG